MQRRENAPASLATASNVFLPFVRPLAAVAMVLAAYIFIGWVFRFQILSALFPARPTMRANTAALFFLAGLSLWFLRADEPSRLQRLAREVCALLVALVALLTLAEHATGRDFGIDQL